MWAASQGPFNLSAPPQVQIIQAANNGDGTYTLTANQTVYYAFSATQDNALFIYSPGHNAWLPTISTATYYGNTFTVETVPSTTDGALVFVQDAPDNVNALASFEIPQPYTPTGSPYPTPSGTSIVSIHDVGDGTYDVTFSASVTVTADNVNNLDLLIYDSSQPGFIPTQFTAATTGTTHNVASVGGNPGCPYMVLLSPLANATTSPKFAYPGPYVPITS